MSVSVAVAIACTVTERANSATALVMKRRAIEEEGMRVVQRSDEGRTEHGEGKGLGLGMVLLM